MKRKITICVIVVLLLTSLVGMSVLAVTPEGIDYRTTTNLALRSGPGTSYPLYLYMPTGSSFVTDYPPLSSAGFYFGTNSGYFGWAYSSYLAFNHYLY